MKQTTTPTGIIPAVITPFDEHNRIRFDLLEKQSNYLSDANVNGFFVCGGTGEGAYLTTAEKIEVFRVIKQTVKKQQFLCFACINPSTMDTIREIKQIEGYQPDYVVVVAPFYLVMNQSDIIAHYKEIANNSQIPIIAYNIPSSTHNPILYDTMQILSEIPNIVAIKDSSGDFCSFSRGLLERRNSDFSWIQGEDYLCGPSFLTGADGAVSGLSNVRIEPYVKMFEAVKNKNWELVKDCQKSINRLYEIIRYGGNGIASIKAATMISGRSTGWMRHTSQTILKEKVNEIAKILEQFDK
ncbi:MAG: dihydrodipicolinate synthase family protein [Sphaerochaetaceae bacterium]|nr:dihydrodipicolinate synthase family protein [Sphaerochaetaceae bacterium]